MQDKVEKAGGTLGALSGPGGHFHYSDEAWSAIAALIGADRPWGGPEPLQLSGRYGSRLETSAEVIERLNTGRWMLEAFANDYIVSVGRGTIAATMRRHFESARIRRAAAERELATAIDSLNRTRAQVELEKALAAREDELYWRNEVPPSAAKPDRTIFLDALCSFWGRDLRRSVSAVTKAVLLGASATSSVAGGPCVEFLMAASRAPLELKGQRALTPASARHAIRDFKQAEQVRRREAEEMFDHHDL